MTYYINNNVYVIYLLHIYVCMIYIFIKDW